MNAIASTATSRARSSTYSTHRMAPRPVHRRTVQIICAALAVASLTVDVQAASETEVKVTGCVVDYGGRPYVGVDVALSGVNYKGGVGSTGNYSEARTDIRGEFTLRMKAGTPERPAHASIRGTNKVYTKGRWTGRIVSEASIRGADAWPESLVENIGKPVDLRPKGCIRFPYPITVLGAVTSENLYEQDPWPHRSSLRLGLSRGDGYLDIGTPIPEDSRRVQVIDFGVAFRSGDTYSVDIIEQPYSLGPSVPPTQKMCIQCDLVRGATETIGQIPDIIIPVGGGMNKWGVQSLRLQCKRRSIVKPDDACETGATHQAAESSMTSTNEATAALSHKDGKKSPDGTHYTGYWFNEHKDGQGTQSWPNGDQYTGSWVENNRQGYGTFTWADGTRFEGMWENDKPFNGTKIAPNGTRVQMVNGEWITPPEQTAAKPSLGSGGGNGAGSLSSSVGGSANSTSATKNSTADNKWPPGIQPGNLYVIKFTTRNKYYNIALLVAARTRDEAVELVTKAGEKYRKDRRFRGDDGYNYTIRVLGECTGPNWGAIIEYTSSKRQVSASSCGAKTPREAILKAAEQCADDDSCTSGNLHIIIGHSGAQPWTDPSLFSEIPLPSMLFSALAAQTGQIGKYPYPHNPQEAIDLLGKACGAKRWGRNIDSCWITSNNVACQDEVTGDPRDGLPNRQQCVDTKLTAEGYFP